MQELRWEGVVHAMMRWTIVILAASANVPGVKLAHYLAKGWCVGKMGKPLGTTMPLPPPEFRLVKLPRNGPKPGQATAAWLWGKDKHWQIQAAAAQWKEGSNG